MRLNKYDLLLIKKPRKLMGKLVKKVLNSQYSHVAIYIGNYHVIDTDFKQSVKIHEINNRLGEFDVYRYRYMFSKKQEELIDEFFQKSLNVKYDLMQAIGVLFRINFNKRGYICISLATEAFRHAGICIDNRKFGFDKIIGNECFIKVSSMSITRSDVKECD